MRPICPLCGQPADVLGQYGPLWPYGVCRACSLAAPYPVEVFIPDPGAKDASRLRIDPDADFGLRERRVALDFALTSAVRGRRDADVYKLNITGRELRHPVRIAQNYAAWRRNPRALQFHLPLCARCGQAHDRRYSSGDYVSHCQACEDLAAVEALWRNRRIFGDDDAESIMDRLYAAFPDLFARGVLPDAWFRLVKTEMQPEAT